MYWDAVWVGALAAIVAAVLFGLIGTALGAHKAGAEGRITTWSGVGLGGLVFAVFASFLAFVIGGWVAARVAGITRAEPAMLHGAIAFLVATVGLLALASFGGAVLSGWYVALAPSPIVPAAPGTPVDPNAAKAAGNGALAAAAAVLLGLAGSVVGGWMGSGEPMNFSYHKTRAATRTSAITSDRTSRM
ncbi:MAG: hypothetical protein AUG02_07940 [Chloroflexi bacterium 13_1_20CM_2_70_9]|nr:MAG: hypothetical protein AUG02_07940 [Chloroflexi bacterium 13_1_20CM_2_70_9]